LLPRRRLAASSPTIWFLVPSNVGVVKPPFVQRLTSSSSEGRSEVPDGAVARANSNGFWGVSGSGTEVIWVEFVNSVESNGTPLHKSKEHGALENARWCAPEHKTRSRIG
jgi:hypothetical protein